MKWFKKSSLEKDVSQSQSNLDSQSKKEKFTWFRKQRNTQNDKTSSQLLNEIDVVPKTEIQISRQALSNISIALGGESSGESSKKYRGESTNDKKECDNKYCCAVIQPKDNFKGENETIKDHENINDLQDAYNSAHSYNELQTAIENQRRNKNLINDKHDNFTHQLIAPVDKSNSECSDLMLPATLMELPSINNDLKNSFETFDDSAAKRNEDYLLQSNIEQNLDDRKFNLKNCMKFNIEYGWNRTSLGSGCRPKWEIEDCDDDKHNTPMHYDTKAVKEFYRLSELDDILIHFHEIDTADDAEEEVTLTGIIKYLVWFFMKGKEIDENHLVKEKKTSWLRKIKNFFKSE